MSDTVVLDGALSLTNVIDGQAGTVIKVTEYDLPVYTGQTEITPSEETQTLQTANRTVLQNIVINPIPSNYGLITRIGAGIRIS